MSSSTPSSSVSLSNRVVGGCSTGGSISTVSTALMATTMNGNDVNVNCKYNNEDNRMFNKPPKIYNFQRGHPRYVPYDEMKELFHGLSLPSHLHSHNTTSTPYDDDDDELLLRTSLNYLPNDRGQPELLRALHDFLHRHTMYDESGSDDDDDDNNNNNNINVGVVDGDLSRNTGDRIRVDKDHRHDHRHGHQRQESKKLELDPLRNYFITNGVSHGLDLLCAVFTQPNDIVYVEYPTYFLVGTIFRSHRLQVRPLPTKTTKTKPVMKVVEAGGGGGEGNHSKTTTSVRYEIDIERFENMLDAMHQQRRQRQQQQKQQQQGQKQKDEGDDDDALFPKMIYIIPSHQNPTGQSMSIQIKRRLARISRLYGIIVVADDVYHLLDWSEPQQQQPQQPPPQQHRQQQQQQHSDQQEKKQEQEHLRPRRSVRMSLLNVADHFEDGNDDASVWKDDAILSYCVSVSSFTKIFSPGLRCGWIEGPNHMIDQICRHGYIVSGGACTPMIGYMMNTALHLNGVLDRVLYTKLIPQYAHKCHLLCTKLRRCLDEKKATSNNEYSTATKVGNADDDDVIQFTEPFGGYFVWVTFPKYVKSQEFLDYTLSDDRGPNQVRFLPGERCDCTDTTVAALRTSSSSQAATATTIDLSNTARLCFAYMDDDDIVQGVKYLVDYLYEFIDYQKESFKNVQ